jgi:putative PIN family toxin of toxin-antitoxin system
MIRVVLDTNILVSALLTKEGNEAALLDFVTRHDIELCVSEPVMAEYAEVLSRPKFRFDPVLVENLLTLVRREGTLVDPNRAAIASSHEPDNRFLECADAAKADYLVTGNTKHFPGIHKRTAIVTAQTFIAIAHGPQPRRE